ncbi:restriction endonuclease subunit S [Treponema sp.]|uniref:restriction endonuclease subunit S n=1 Tax=Treponema sp. TaxID=166 RepID=UPI00298DB9B2|nr:restriction endonuclease subunit S [Treponema sp.]
MEEWKECKLGDYCDFQNGYAFKSSEFKTNVEYKIVKIKELKDGLVKFFDDSASVDIHDIKEFEKYKIYRNDVLFALTGDPVSKPNPLSWVGRVSIYRSDENALLNQRTCKIKKSDEIDNQFLYYYFRQWENFYALASKTTGSASQANISTNTIADTIIKLPHLPTQQKIARILSSLDDKIELNNKINTNLEQQAGVLFKNRFVDFEPFGDKMPEEWKVGKLSELINVKYGKDHKKSNDGNCPVYGSGGIMRYVEKFLYDKESVLIPRKGTLNNVFYINESFWSVDTMFYTEMKKENIAKYVYFFVKSKDLNAMNAGSAVPSMTTEILNAMEVLIPSDEYLEKFENIVSPMFKQIKQCIIENENLASIRDTLLPKLMNGEIEV